MSSKKETANGEMRMADRLPPKEIDKILDKFSHYGLRADEDQEYFTWQLNGRKIFIPKQSEIPSKVDGRVVYIKVAEYIKQLIKKETEQAEKNN